MLAFIQFLRRSVTFNTYMRIPIYSIAPYGLLSCPSFDRNQWRLVFTMKPTHVLDIKMSFKEKTDVQLFILLKKKYKFYTDTGKSVCSSFGRNSRR